MAGFGYFLNCSRQECTILIVSQFEIYIKNKFKLLTICCNPLMVDPLNRSLLSRGERSSILQKDLFDSYTPKIYYNSNDIMTMIDL